MRLESISMVDLLCTMHKRRLVCWGIGNYFRAFLDSISEYENDFEFAYLIDNNVKEQSRYRMINGKRIPIISFHQYLSLKRDQDLMIITTVHYQAIINQIEESETKVDYVAYPLVRHAKCSNICIRRSGEMKIPAIIHYCWFGGSSIPVPDRTYIEGWREKCPEYEIVCWNESNFDINRNVYVKWAYEKKMWAFVSDYVRLYALYKFGGIYLDTDVELLKNLDELRFQYAYMGMEESGCVNSGVGMGSMAHNPVIGEMVKTYDKININEMRNLKNWKVNAAWETELLRKYGFKANNQYQIVKDIAIFPSEFFSPVLVGQEGISVTENTFSIHHYHYSWLSDEEREQIWNKRYEDETDEKKNN